jgi:hypothetical protein
MSLVDDHNSSSSKRAQGYKLKNFTRLFNLDLLTIWRDLQEIFAAGLLNSQTRPTFSARGLTHSLAHELLRKRVSRQSLADA